MKKVIVLGLSSLIVLTSLTGCSHMTRRQRNALIGGAVGGGVGYAVGGGTGAVIGAASGAIVGAAVTRNN